MLNSPFPAVLFQSLMPEVSLLFPVALILLTSPDLFSSSNPKLVSQA